MFICICPGCYGERGGSVFVCLYVCRSPALMFAFIFVLILVVLPILVHLLLFFLFCCLFTFSIYMHWHPFKKYSLKMFTSCAYVCVCMWFVCTRRHIVFINAFCLIACLLTFAYCFCWCIGVH